MISQDDVVGCGRDGRGRSASMKGHAAVPKAVDEILIERRTGLTVDVAAEEEGGRGRGNGDLYMAKDDLSCCCCTHLVSRPSLKAPTNRGDTTKRNSKFLWIPTVVDRYVTLCKSPRLALCKIDMRGSQIIPQ